ncbi:MAG TPA: hypothetical protein VFE64_01265 [Devosia sp.]|jgi:hypothetical protein|nr:hypothetical protein [Devosia sp.]
MTTRLMFGALVLGSVLALSAGTAMAAPPPPNFSFGIHIGPDSPPPPPPDFQDCMSTRAILGQLRYAGYRNFTNFDDSGDDSFFVDARRGSKWYELEVDSCDGSIINRTRIKFPN